MLLIEYVAIATGITANTLMVTAKHDHLLLSYLAWIISSTLWVIIGIMTGMYSIIILNSYFVILDIVCFIRWRRKIKKDRSKHESN